MAAVQVLGVGELDAGVLEAVEACVRSGIGLETRRAAGLPAPAYAYDSSRRQYLSIAIMHVLLERFPESQDKVLAVTAGDIFIPVLSFVFGQAQLGGRVALVSTARLKQEFYGLPGDHAIMLGRLSKEVVHELGHTFGLVHCADKTCAMALSTDIRQVDLKRAELCESCRLWVRETIDRDSGAIRRPECR